jgi:tetratricopeptide (TPR) repeat protein
MMWFAIHRNRANEAQADITSCRWIKPNLGNTDEALKLLAYLSLRDARGYFIISKVAWAYHVAGEFDEAISEEKKVSREKPHSVYALRFLVASLARKRRFDGAAEAIREVLNVEPELTLARPRARLIFIGEKVRQSRAINERQHLAREI